MNTGSPTGERSPTIFRYWFRSPGTVWQTPAVLKRLPAIVIIAATALTMFGGAVRAEGAPAQSKYVALGDSFSAGVGTRAEKDGCYRSDFGYPALLADQYGLALDYQACASAKTSDVAANQLDALSADTTYVSMTIGGNDVGFSKVLTECAKPGWVSDCDGAIAGGRAVLNTELPGRYDALFGEIRSRASNATVAVAGYPLLFNGEDCNAGTFFSEKEQSSLNSATDDLDALIAQKAATNQLGYVDPRPSFAGKAVCDNPEWINGLSNPIKESYHPNRDGNVGYAALVGPALTGRAADMTALRRKASEADEQVSREDQVRQQAELVLSWDLTSAENLARAEQRGISADQVRTATEQLRSGDAETITRGLDTLQALDRKVS